MSQKWRSLWFSVTKERSKEKQMQKQQNVSKRGKENQFWWSRKMQSHTGKRKMFTGNSQHQIRNQISSSISYQKWKLTRLHQWGCHLHFSIYSAPTKAIRKLLSWRESKCPNRLSSQESSNMAIPRYFPIGNFKSHPFSYRKNKSRTSHVSINSQSTKVKALTDFLPVLPNHEKFH